MFDVISNTAETCFIPLTVGGGVRNINDFPVLKKLLTHCNENFKNANLKIFNHISMLIYLGADICIKCLLQADHTNCENCSMGKHHDYLGGNSKTNTQKRAAKRPRGVGRVSAGPKK